MAVLSLNVTIEFWLNKTVEWSFKNIAAPLWLTELLKNFIFEFLPNVTVE